MLRILVSMMLIGCGTEIKVEDSEHRIIFEICDKETFPDPVERRQCIGKVLDLLD